MNKEFLKKLGLDDDVIDKIIFESDKELKSAALQHKDELKNITTKLDEANANLVEFENIKNSADDFKSKFESSEKEVQRLKDTLKQAKFDSVLDSALTQSGARSAKALKGLLDMSKIKLENGNLSGFDEQIEGIRSEHEYLFGEAGKICGGMRQGSGAGMTDTFISNARAAAGLGA